MKRPWFKFYPGDWKADVGLQACSLSARGFWIEAMSAMHQGSPYGHLSLDGKAPAPITILARLVGCSEAETTAALVELSAAGVLSRTSAGVVFSRRMVRDEHRRLVGLETGPQSLETEHPPGGRGGSPSRARGRALAYSNSSSSDSGSGVSGPDQKRPRKSRAPKAPATGPLADCQRHWESEWSRTRLGTRWSWVGSRDSAAIANVLRETRGATPQEVMARMTRMLEDSEDWVLKGARPAFLENHWNRWSVTVRSGASGNAAERMLRERIAGGGS